LQVEEGQYIKIFFSPMPIIQSMSQNQPSAPEKSESEVEDIRGEDKPNHY
jgi:hypothetical protein